VAERGVVQALVVGCVPLLVLLVLHDVAQVRDPKRLPLGLVVLVLALPFFQLLFDTRTLIFVWQLGSAVVALSYVFLLLPSERTTVLRSVLTLLALFAMLSLTGPFALAANGALDSRALLSSVSFALSGGYLFVGAAIRVRASSAERAVRILVYGGLMQLPIVVAQAAGLTQGFAGSLEALDSRRWGGSIETAALVRYPGSFGDYELFAEWMGILFILAVGGAIFTRGRTRAGLTLASAAILGMGMLTATRGFVVAIVLVLLLVVPAVLVSQRGRGFGGLLAVVTSAVVGMIYVVPDVARTGMLTRLLASEASGVNAFNRLGIFRVWGYFAARMPWYGYGWDSPILLQAFALIGVGYPHSAYFYFLLSAGWPGLLAVLLFFAAVLFSARGDLIRDVTAIYRVFVLGTATLYFVVSELKIEFVRLPFYVDLLLVLFGILAADSWARADRVGRHSCEEAETQETRVGG